MSTLDGSTTALAIGGRTTNCNALRESCSGAIGAAIISYDNMDNDRPDDILVMNEVTWDGQKYQVTGVQVI